MNWFYTYLSRLIYDTVIVYFFLLFYILMIFTDAIYFFFDTAKYLNII